MITAFSKKFQIELDPKQLLLQLGHDTENDPNSREIDDKLRSFIEKDIECPSCGVIGATIVRGSVDESTGHETKQAHYRFPSNTHDPFCDFFEDQSRTNIPDLVEFNHKKSNRESTRYIAELVSKGIELEQIIHNDLREFRHWHFDVKKSNPVEVSISISACLDYQRYISHINDMEREDSAFREYIAPVTEKISSQLRERASRDQYIDSIC